MVLKELKNGLFVNMFTSAFLLEDLTGGIALKKSNSYCTTLEIIKAGVTSNMRFFSSSSSVFNFFELYPINL